MKTEKLPPTESLPSSPSPEASSAFLNDRQITTIDTIRQSDLISIKELISLKLYYKIQDKLEREHTRLQQILDIHQGKHTHQAKYTHILDDHYFEQQLLN